MHCNANERAGSAGEPDGAPGEPWIRAQEVVIRAYNVNRDGRERKLKKLADQKAAV